MDHGREPLVDSGMIQVAVAISVLGFVLLQIGQTNEAIGIGTAVFVLGGFGTLLLYAVYLYQWRRRHGIAWKELWSPFRSPITIEFSALLAHTVLFIGLLVFTVFMSVLAVIALFRAIL